LKKTWPLARFFFARQTQPGTLAADAHCMSKYFTVIQTIMQAASGMRPYQGDRSAWPRRLPLNSAGLDRHSPTANDPDETRRAFCVQKVAHPAPPWQRCGKAKHQLPAESH
jgi:hypothetical protein